MGHSLILVGNPRFTSEKVLARVAQKRCLAIIWEKVGNDGTFSPYYIWYFYLLKSKYGPYMSILVFRF